MGGYNFRPSRIHDATSMLLATRRIKRAPPWFETVGDNPPSQILVRTQPVQHIKPSPNKRKGRPSKQFKPQKIVYEEDALRKTFFTDHPWELARPRVVLEDDGRDYQRMEKGPLENIGQSLNGESVIQRQLQLMHGDGTESGPLSRNEAYDQARREFYDNRLLEEVESRVAKEEAMAVGAYFGKTTVQVGAELEDISYSGWRLWADRTYTEQSNRQAGSTYQAEDADDTTAINQDSAQGADQEENVSLS